MKEQLDSNHNDLLKQSKKTNNSTIGCLVFLLILVGVFIYFYNSKSSDDEYSSDVNPCLMSEDFIKRDLKFPDEADFPFLDCNSTDNGNGTYTVLRKISAKNAFGVEKKYIYKVEMRYNGGISVDINNWELISLRSEESY